MQQQTAPQIVPAQREAGIEIEVPPRGRKPATAVGNRTWTEEEEKYLVQTRAQKMPYKHIAAYLKKTELACRLHYHQLSHGNHRRKRNVSVSSSNSNSSASSMSSSSPRSQYRLRYGHDDRTGYDYRLGVTSVPSYGSQKLLLPKPTLQTGSAGDFQSVNNPVSLQTTSMSATNRNFTDTTRLGNMYDDRVDCWPQMPIDYSTTASAAVWQHNLGGPVRAPPTPDSSPDRIRSMFSPMPMSAYQNYGGGAYAAAARPSTTSSTQFGALAAHHDTSRLAFFPHTAHANFGLAQPQNFGRANMWQYAVQAPQPTAPTAISSLLNDSKCPRGAECTGFNCLHNHF